MNKALTTAICSVLMPGMMVVQDGEISAAGEPEVLGVVAVQPVTGETCVAVEVTLEENQLVDGLKWYNNDSESVYPYVMAVAGFPGSPPNLADAIVILEDVAGAEDGWSEVSFTQAVQSPTNLFYVVFQLPANEQAIDRGIGPGIGYAVATKETGVYITADGAEWLKMVTSKKLLVEPVIADGAAKSGKQILRLPKPSETSNNEPQVEPDREIVQRTELLAAYPNPFNPSTRIVFTLKEASPVQIGIYDVRGRQIKSTRVDHKSPGRFEFVWHGDSDSGHRVASGVYFVRMQAGRYEGVQRVVMLK